MILASSLDYAVTLERVAQLTVPTLADWCVVHILEDDRLVQLAVAHVDPSKVKLAYEIQRRYPTPQHAPQGVAAVARGGQSEIHPTISDEMLVRSARDEEHLRITRELGLRSAMIVPLVARGRSLGAITMIRAESADPYGADDLALAEELGRRAGIAVDNARLFGETQEAVKIRDDFLSIAGHELRTPLTALMLQVGSLRRAGERGDGDLLAKLPERIDKMAANGARLERLIDTLLDVSRITTQRLHLDFEPMDLEALAREIVDRFSEESERAGSPIALTAVPAPGIWDRARLDQVMTNLLSNALKYGPGRPVEVEVQADAERAILTVRDHGIGIDPRNQKRIFGRFERAVSERHYGGFGLGLWIAREIVEAHGGEIMVTSTPGQGACFTVTLPRKT
jgi:signal transduction histidine kinase